MENEQRTTCDVEGHRFSPLHKRVSRGNTRQMCSRCGLMIERTPDGWVDVQPRSRR